ncbi:hypothetical protein Desor_2195 [Desulfosporosinus orientis DSM 765]|uniref:Uncharacterized protein n=1 Tax=Desulfosporosinus orientis (strain ATCC 19365 / DSM 765 / NCIMB 8382 / VKM B-1628 / Singapore I) TaxID=768706 RepID=G7W8T7_DESOD|nr:hypothetical protein Desor_2195 [Desulfosporosinus orientis DSM 765]
MMTEPEKQISTGLKISLKFIVAALVFMFLAGCSAAESSPDGPVPVRYQNTQYGFSFVLPPEWEIIRLLMADGKAMRSKPAGIQRLVPRFPSAIPAGLRKARVRIFRS